MQRSLLPVIHFCSLFFSLVFFCEAEVLRCECERSLSTEMNGGVLLLVHLVTFFVGFFFGVFVLFSSRRKMGCIEILPRISAELLNSAELNNFGV